METDKVDDECLKTAVQDPIFFQPFFLKIFINTPLAVSFQKKIDLDLGAVTIGAELTRLGANGFGVEVQDHFLRVVDVSACVTRTCHKLGVMDLGVELDILYFDVEL